MCQPQKSIRKIDIVTTDYFAFDDNTNHYQLNGLGSAVEMGDAIIGIACLQIPNPPKWILIHNISDPQISGKLSIY